MDEEITKILKNIKKGFVESRESTKIETHKESKEYKDKAWDAGGQILVVVRNYLFLEDGSNIEMSSSCQGLKLLYFEILKTFQNSFRLAEEGYYRCAFGELRDILEIVMKIKLFGEDKKSYQKYVDNPKSLFTTKTIRKTDLFKNYELNDKIEKLTQTFSNNRHASFATLDSKGKVITNVSYYRKDLFEKWCKHMILLKNISIEIVGK